jgi:UDP-N-acetyl-D-glucosamine dehydrogenase
MTMIPVGRDGENGPSPATEVSAPIREDGSRRGHRRLVVVGQGYVGLPLAMRAVEVGYDVVGFDLDVERIKRLSVGQSYVEDISDSALAEALATGRFRPATEAKCCAGFDVAVITVPTPLRDGNPDLSYVESAARCLARYVRPDTVVILESTTYPGTTEELVGPILEEGSGLVAGVDFHLGYSPERIDPGNPHFGLENTPKVVSGLNEASLAAVADFYATLVEHPVPVSGLKEAELTKLLENTYRHVNIALVNEMAIFAADLGIDIWEVIDAASTKPFGFQRFTPGPGVGGHCLPIDPSYLSWRVRRALGHPFRFIELANDVNEHMPDYVVRRLITALNRERKSVNGSSILLLGLAYKRNSGDAREAPAMVVASQLLDLGAVVSAVDPHVVEDHVDRRIRRVELTAEELAAADAVVILTDHDQFDVDLVENNARYVLDTRRFARGASVEHL